MEAQTAGGDALRVAHVSKRYGPTWALDDVSFTVRAGEIHALLGGNGSGKSTLIKIMAGVVRADAGRLTVAGDEPIDVGDLTPRRARTAGLRFVHQDLPIFPELSIAENLALGGGFVTGSAGRIQWRRQNRLARKTLTRFEIELDPRLPASSLSPAGRTLLSIARALGDNPENFGAEGHDAQPHVLVLDEPTATLPRREVDLLMATVRRLTLAGIAVVLVDHRLDEIIGHADSFTVLRDGRHVATRPLAGHTTDDLVQLIVGGAIEKGPMPSVRENTSSASDLVSLTLDHLSAGGAQNVSLTVAPGEVIGLAGLAGAGSSSVLRAIAGDVSLRGGRVLLGDSAMNSGQIRQARRAGIVYVPDHRPAIGFADMDIAANITGRRVARFVRAGILSRRREHRAAEQVMRLYQVVAASSYAPLSSLSGGNQQKVILAAALDLQPRVLLLDEPTQGVDVGARAAIHDLIRTAATAGACVLVASSDLSELAGLCARVVVLRRGVVTGEVTGGELTEHTLLAAIQNTEIETADRPQASP